VVNPARETVIITGKNVLNESFPQGLAIDFAGSIANRPTVSPLRCVSDLRYWFLADCTATQYDRLLASSCRPSVRLSVCDAAHSGS